MCLWDAEAALTGGVHNRAGGGRGIDGGLTQFVPAEACGVPRAKFKSLLGTYLNNGPQVITPAPMFVRRENIVSPQIVV